MPATSRLYGFFVLLSFWPPALLGQINAPPPDPHELVTREPRTLTKTDERSAAIDLLDRARKNFEIYYAKAPYALKVSFETNGATQLEGAGTMEEFYDGNGQFRWTAQLGDVHVTRVGADHRVYGTDPSQPIPLRIQLVRTVLLKPVQHDIATFVIRAADVELDGKPLTCFLLMRSQPTGPGPRDWRDRENCIDPATGLLRMWSEAPGIYATYDYNGGDFHGRVLPRQISVYEEGRLAVQIHVDSLEDAPSLDANLFKPSPEMGDAQETFNLSGASRPSSLRVDPADGPTSHFYQPVIVHAILDAENGMVLDAETLQDSSDALGRAALDLVRSTAFDATGFQQEVFVSVHFHLPAARIGGPPIAVFRSARVHWVPVGWHPRTAPSPRPHGGK
jgi:hypothetical protein